MDVWQFFVQRRRPSIICYHDPDPKLFAAHVDALKRHFNIISLRDYITARLDNAVHTLPDYSLIITIDDGLAGNFKLLEVIAERRVPVTIFLTSGVVGTNRHFWWTYVQSEDEFQSLKRESHEDMVSHLGCFGFEKMATHATRQALSAREIQEMAPYVDFQAHTRFHPVLPMCSEDEAFDEIHGCKRELSERFSLDVYALAYPHGNYSERDIALAKQAGYLCALTVDEGLNSKSTDAFRLKRIYIPDDAGLMEVVTKASGVWAALTRSLKKKPAHGFERT